MSEPKRVIAISGSLRQASYNTHLLRAAVSLAPAALQLEEASIADVPLYHGDVEAEHGVPQAVAELQRKIAASDGVLLVSPEYNGSVPGVLKNAVDWLSRPPAEALKVFQDRPIAVIGASGGRFGTTLGQSAWLPVFRQLGARPYLGAKVMVGPAKDSFDAAGELTDERIRKQLHAFLQGFAAFVGAA